MININEVKYTLIICQYLKCYPFIPKLDALLDWRLRLIELKEQDKPNADLYDLEIKGNDFIIQEHYS